VERLGGRGSGGRGEELKARRGKEVGGGGVRDGGGGRGGVLEGRGA